MANFVLTFSSNTSAALNGIRELRGSINTLAATFKEKHAEMLQTGANLSMVFHGVKSAVSTIISAISGTTREFSRFEDNATRLAPLVGGLESAKNLCEALRDEAANGTMSFEELTSVAGRLATVFKNPEDIKKWTTAFHDLSAGTGLNVQELVGNFVKSKASGRFKAGFMDMFAQKGVNIYAPLAKELGMAEAELRKMAATGKLSFAEVEKAILAASTGTGQFAGQAAAMSNTLSGSIGTMAANWDTLRAKFMEPIAESVTPMIQKIASFLAENKQRVSEWGKSFANIAPALAIAVGAIVAVKTAMIALNTVMAMNPIMLAVSAVAVLGVTIYAFLQDTETLTDIVTASNKRWEDSLKNVKRAYEDIDTRAALEAQKKQDDRRIADKKAAFEEKHPNFDLEDAKFAQSMLKHVEKTGKTFVYSGQIDHWREQTAALLEYENILKEADAIEAAYNERKANVDVIEADDARKKKTDELKDAAEKAREAYLRLNEEIAKKADEKALSETHFRMRPQVLLEQAGIDDAETLNMIIEEADAALAVDAATGNATAEQVAKYKELLELRERYNKLSEEAQAADTRLTAAKEEHDLRKKILDAELSGNAKLARQLERQNELAKRREELTAKYKAAGMDELSAEARADEIIEKEDALKEKTRAEEKAREKPEVRGEGPVATSQASVGGGRTLNLGMDAAVSVAREQLNVAKTMLQHLGVIADNTAGTTGAVIA